MATSAAVEYRRRFHRTRRWIWIGVAAIVVIGLSTLAYVYRSPFGWGFDRMVGETGSITAALVCLALGLLALLWLALWLLFPIVVYIGLKDLRRRTSEMEETTRLCARHLARLTSDRAAPQNERTPRQDPTE